MNTESSGEAASPYLDEVDANSVERLPADGPDLAAHDGDNDHEHFMGDLLDDDDDDPLVF